MDAAVDKTRAGCLIGSAMGGMHSFSTATEALHTQSHRSRAATSSFHQCDRKRLPNSFSQDGRITVSTCFTGT